MKHTAKSWKNPLPQEPGTRYNDLEDDDCVPELGGSRPDRLAGVRPQERVQRHTVEQIIDLVPLLMLDAPEPLMVDQLPESLKFGVVQVLEVPKISQDSIPQRRLLSEPRLVEQLVEVPVPEGGILARGKSVFGVEWCQVAARGGATGGRRALATSAQLQFQQSFVEYVEVPQLHFIDRVVGISVASQRQGSQCKLCRRPEIRQVQFLDRLGHARRCATTGPDGPDSSVWRCRRYSSRGFGRVWRQ